MKRQWMTVVCAALWMVGALSGCCQQEEGKDDKTAPTAQKKAPEAAPTPSAGGDKADGDKEAAKDNGADKAAPTPKEDGAEAKEAAPAGDDKAADGMAGSEEAGGEEAGDQKDPAEDVEPLVDEDTSAAADRDPERLTALSKLAQADPEQGWEGDYADFARATVVINVQEDKAGSAPPVKLTLVKGDKLIDQETDAAKLLGNDAKLKETFSGCTNWSGDLLKTTRVGRFKAIQASFWCTMKPKDGKGTVSLQWVNIYALKKGRTLERVDQLELVWSGIGGSSQLAEGPCMQQAQASFNAPDVRTLIKKTTYTASPYQNPQASQEEEEAAGEPPTCEAPEGTTERFSL